MDDAHSTKSVSVTIKIKAKKSTALALNETQNCKTNKDTYVCLLDRQVLLNGKKPANLKRSFLQQRNQRKVLIGALCAKSELHVACHENENKNGIG